MVCLAISSWILVVSIPAVSISFKSPFQMNNYFLSLVIPGIGSVKARLSPTMQLYNVDFPEFGRPIMQTV